MHHLNSTVPPPTHIMNNCKNIFVIVVEHDSMEYNFEIILQKRTETPKTKHTARSRIFILLYKQCY
jgi:hypothetical protein